MSVPTIPDIYTHILSPNRPFDVDTNISGFIRADHDHSGSIETIMGGELNTNNVLILSGNSESPVLTENKFEITNLPKFTLQDIKDLRKMRVKIPNYSNICFKMMGIELFSICMGGETQMITEPYEASEAELCEDNCCQPDTRPFPDKGNIEEQ